MGYFIRRNCARRDAKRQLAEQQWDPIFVHCSSVAQYVEHIRDVPSCSTSATWTPHKWIEYANCKPMPISWGYQFEGAKMKMAEKRLARRFDLCTATTRAEWRT